MPGGVDAMLLLLAASRPSWMLIYVATAIVGSTAGSVCLYMISKRAGHRALNRFSESKQKRVKDLIDRYDVLSVLVACVLPPPFPLKLFVVSAGVFRLSVWRFAAALAIPRPPPRLHNRLFSPAFGDRIHALLPLHHTAPRLS